MTTIKKSTKVHETMTVNIPARIYITVPDATVINKDNDKFTTSFNFFIKRINHE